MGKKILLGLLIVFVLYIIAIFKAPVFADSVEKFFKIDGFNDWVIDFKAKMDFAFTNMPTTDEIKDAYNKTLSGAENIKDYAGSGTQEFKNKIDAFRLTLSGGINKYDGVRRDVLDSKERIEQTIQDIKEAGEMLNNFSNFEINSSGSLETN